MAYELRICDAILGRGQRSEIQQSVHTAPARRILCREQDFLETVPMICEGWACCAVMLSDGSRQIFSFLLPGDPMSTALLFGSKPNCFVETITPVTYRLFRRETLRAILFSSQDSLDKLGRLRLEEQARSDSLIVDLGRRSAEERIARLVLGLMDRLQQRGLVEGNPLAFEFPLRLHHVADATGLTPVHVSKVLSDFKRRGLIRLDDRTLTLLDTAAFGRIAQMR
jgi:CRP-like cAMP-binding protein